MYCGKDFDAEVTRYVAEEMVKHGLDLRYRYNSSKITDHGDSKTVHFDNGETLSAETVIMAIGREPLIDSIGLENTEIKTKMGAIAVDEWQNTSVDGVYSIGDVTGRDMLTPVATATGRKLAERVFNNKANSKMDFTNIPTVMFTHPPVGCVGLTEAQAIAEYGSDGIQIFRESTMDLHYSMRDSDEEKCPTLCKLIVRKADDKVIGFHTAGKGADEMT